MEQEEAHKSRWPSLKQNLDQASQELGSLPIMKPSSKTCIPLTHLIFTRRMKIGGNGTRKTVLWTSGRSTAGNPCRRNCYTRDVKGVCSTVIVGIWHSASVSEGDVVIAAISSGTSGLTQPASAPIDQLMQRKQKVKRMKVMNSDMKILSQAV